MVLTLWLYFNYSVLILFGGILKGLATNKNIYLLGSVVFLQKVSLNSLNPNLKKYYTLYSIKIWEGLSWDSTKSVGKPGYDDVFLYFLSFCFYFSRLPPSFLFIHLFSSFIISYKPVTRHGYCDKTFKDMGLFATHFMDYFNYSIWGIVSCNSMRE